MSGRISIIVCAFNAAETLGECLESLRKQDYPDTEIIVVNDASTDRTAHLLNELARDAGRELCVVSNPDNLGVAGSRNAGIGQATGRIIAFTDADCVAEPNWLSELVRGFEHGNVAAVGGSISDREISTIWELSAKGHDFVAHAEGPVSYIQGCNMAFDAQILRQFLFNAEITYGYEEALLCDELIAAGYSISYRPQAVVHHRHRSDLVGSLRQKYLRGRSSVWYRKKRNMPVMFTRHFVLLTALLLLPFVMVQGGILYLSAILFLVFAGSLLRDEVLIGKKSLAEIIITFPFLVIIEMWHFAGAIAGLVEFRRLGPSSAK